MMIEWRNGTNGTVDDRAVDIFFYGLFMDVDVLRQAGVVPTHPRKASVEDFELCIGQRATLRPSAGRRVYGMLFCLTRTEIDRLYSAPGLEQYRPEAILARPFEGAPIPALCYTLRAVSEAADRNPGYAGRLQQVLKRLDFPAEYVASIGSVRDTGIASEAIMDQASPFPYATFLDVLYPALTRIDVGRLVENCTHSWYNQTLCRVNDSVVRLGVVQGEYHWHQHDSDDEFFFVLSGRFIIDTEGESIDLAPWQGYVVPRGTRHRTRAPERSVILMVETAAIVPTGDA